MIPCLHIVLNGVRVEVLPQSLELGYVVTANPGPHCCRGCGEDLVFGPCRRGAAECSACGCKHPLVSSDADLPAHALVVVAPADGPVMPGMTADTSWPTVQQWLAGGRN